MPTTRLLQRSLAGGEVAPEMFGRVDDVHFQNGAAKIQNMIVRPQGTARTRPGFQFVRETKRDAWTVSGVNTGSDTITTALAHGLATGESVYLTVSIGGSLPGASPALVAGTLYYAIVTSTVDLKIATTRANALAGTAIDLTSGGSGTLWVNTPNRQKSRLIPFTFSTDQTAVVEVGRAVVDGRQIGYFRFHTGGATQLYAVPSRLHVVPSTFSSVSIGLEEITMTGSHNLLTGDPIAFTRSNDAVLPTPLLVDTTYYAIFVSATVIAVAASYTDAIAGTRINLTAAGADNTGTRKVHFAYVPGDLVQWGGAGPGTFYCMKRPWKQQFSGVTAVHPDHSPTDTIYWFREDPLLVYEVPHYFEQTAIFDVHYAQSFDVLTLVHPTIRATELRRLGATKWTWTDVAFNQAVAAPSPEPALSPFLGEGMKVTATTGATPISLTTTSNHQFVEGDTVQVSGLSGAPGIPDGLYEVGPVTATNLQLKNLESGVLINGTAAAGLDGRVRFVSASSFLSNSYVVTAVAENGEESVASPVGVTNCNLLVSGAYVDVSWNAVTKAARYRIYKLQTGLYGFIGEVLAPTVTFRDDNIAPDLGVTPPILDGALAIGGTVTFDATNELVVRTAHGLIDGAPVRFDTDGALPTLTLGGSLLVGTTYYVVNASTNAFQIATTPGGAPLAFSSAGTGTHTIVYGAWPGAVAYFEQRRVFGGAITLPQDVWMTRSGTEEDMSFRIPVQDSDRIHFRIASREASTVRHLLPLAHLVPLTSSAEYRVTPLNSDAITPDSIAVRPQSYVGANNAQPAVVNSTLVFAAARGGHVRELGFSQDILGYVTGDLSLRALQLFDGQTIAQIAYAKAPHPVVWFVSSSGLLLGLTYVPEEQVGAWHRHVTDGTFESCAAVAEGDEDRLYVVVKRNINGTDVRYVERLSAQDFTTLAAAFQVDAGLTYSGAPVTTVSNILHLEGEQVAVLADGVSVGPKTVTGGAITLLVAASTVHVGLAFTAQVDTLPIVMQVEALAQSRTKNVNKVWVRTVDSAAFEVGPLGGTMVSSDPRGEQVAVQTKLTEVVASPAWQDDGQVALRVTKPVPVEIVAVVLEVAVGG